LKQIDGANEASVEPPHKLVQSFRFNPQNAPR
jgi:hypothetical protein